MKSKRLERVRRDLRDVQVDGGTSEQLAQALAKTGGQVAKFKAHNAYTAARQAGRSHDQACEEAARHVGTTALYANDLIQEYRKDAAPEIALTFDYWRCMGLPVDEALLKTMFNWGFGDGKADQQGRTAGRGIEDLKALLTSQGRDVSDSSLKAKRAPRK